MLQRDTSLAREDDLFRGDGLLSGNGAKPLDRPSIGDDHILSRRRYPRDFGSQRESGMRDGLRCRRGCE